MAPWHRNMSKCLLVHIKGGVEGSHEKESRRLFWAERPSYTKVWKQLKRSQEDQIGAAIKVGGKSLERGISEIRDFLS